MIFYKVLQVDVCCVCVSYICVVFAVDFYIAAPMHHLPYKVSTSP